MKSRMSFFWTRFWMLFSWWNGATYGTLVNTWFRGVPVGTDSFGNRYYQSRDGQRRWVIYNGVVDGSRVPPEWFNWIRHTSDTPPSPEMKKKSWQKDYLPNLSGTEAAYHPSGSLARGGHRQSTTGDYESWSPNA